MLVRIFVRIVIRLWRFPLYYSGNRHKRRQAAPRGANRRGMVAPTLGGGANRRWRQSAVAVAPIGVWRWRQSAFGGGANRRLAVAPIGGGRWRGQPGNRVATARLKFSVYLPRKTMLVIRI